MKELKDIMLKEGDKIYFDDGSYMVNLMSRKIIALINITDIAKIERPVKYETIYEAPKQILDKEEKEYLEAVIRPFRDRVISLHKLEICIRGKEWISIDIKNDGSIHLPLFDKGTMYKGMELNKEYTLDELGLFKEKTK